MLIRYGYNIEIELIQPTTIVTAMDVHYSSYVGPETRFLSKSIPDMATPALCAGRSS
jgi:hypothetical protein